MRKICLAVVFCGVGLEVSNAQSYQLHSVFMYSFTRYIQWPEESNQGDFEIHVLGDSPILAELKKMSESKKVGDRPIRVARLGALTDIKKCNILFIPADKSGQLPDILMKVGENSTLIVTEQSGVGAKGSGINFIEKDGKLAFEINQSALAKQRLKASTELMRFGVVI